MSQDEVIELLKEGLGLEHVYCGLRHKLNLTLFGEVISSVDVSDDGLLR